MKRLFFALICVCLGLMAFSAQYPDGSALTEQLQAKPLTGYVNLGEVDSNGWVPVEYVGTENVTMTATVDGSNVSIVNHKIKLPSYGTHVVVVTVSATGYATLTVTFDDVTWEQDPYASGCWVVLLDRFGNEFVYYLMYSPHSDYYILIDLPTKEFGNGVVHFYFYIDGVAYGATEEDTQIVIEDYSQNPLTAHSSCYYTVQSGYSYLISVLKKVNSDYEIEGYYALVSRGGPIAEPDYLRGDVDGDKAVNIADVTSLIDYLLSGNTQIDQYNADVDDDGKISITDVTVLIDMMLH